MKVIVLKMFLVYAIRDVLYSLSFSYLGQGLYIASINFFDTFLSSLIFMTPLIIINFIITGIPLYFIAKKIKGYNLRIGLILFLILIDLILNSILFNLKENYLYAMIRVVFFSISIFSCLVQGVPRFSKYPNKN